MLVLSIFFFFFLFSFFAWYVLFVWGAGFGGKGAKLKAEPERAWSRAVPWGTHCLGVLWEMLALSGLGHLQNTEVVFLYFFECKLQAWEVSTAGGLSSQAMGWHSELPVDSATNKQS